MAAGSFRTPQGRYRDHLDTNVIADETRPDITPEAISISRDWPVILDAVEAVLGDQPELRDQLLLALANGHADAVVPAEEVPSARGLTALVRSTPRGTTQCV